MAPDQFSKIVENSMKPTRYIFEFFIINQKKTLTTEISDLTSFLKN